MKATREFRPQYTLPDMPVEMGVSTYYFERAIKLDISNNEAESLFVLMGHEEAYQLGMQLLDRAMQARRAGWSATLEGDEK
jgi:hypothetical protein